jgi:hypothetical protein
MKISPRRTVETFEAAMAKTENPVHRAMLETMKVHYTAEVVGDIDALMATMAPNPVYHVYGMSTDPSPKSWQETYDFYKKGIDELSLVHELAIDRIAVADWGIAGVGQYHMITPAAVIVAGGGDAEAGTHYLLSNRCAFSIPFEDGKMAGEDIYLSEAHQTLELLDPADVVLPAQALD